MGQEFVLLLSIWRLVKIFCFTLLFLIILPLILLFFLPIYILRFFVSKINSIIYSDNGKILSTKSAVFAADKMYTKPKCPLLVYFLFEGNVDINQIRDKINRDLIHKRNKAGQLVYPQTQQYITKFLGFFVWRWEVGFSIDDHVNEYDGILKDTTITEDLVPVLSNELTIKPFRKGKSPWEGFIIPNTRIKTYSNFYSLRQDTNTEFYNMTGSDDDWDFSGEQSAAIFRLHHSIADGLSLRFALMDLVGYKMKNTLPQSPKLSPCQKLMKMITFPICAPFETIGALIDAHDVNDWHLPENKLTGELSGASTIPIRVDFIKEIKNVHRVSFAAVVLSAVAGGIRNFAAENVQLPSKISVLTPLPMKGHSEEKLENHLTAAAIRLPLGCSSAATRLQSVHFEILKLQKSYVPICNYYFYPIIGGLFPFMIECLFKV